jgi:hypothetical protein
MKQFHEPHLKMYILVRKRVPIGIGTVNAAHAALATYIKFKDDQEIKKWLKAFYKVVVAVSDTQFRKAKRIPHHVVIREDRYHNSEIAMAFKPRMNWPKSFLEFPLYPDREA